ncbi:hypothetical protein [Actinospongicola halichondriae]|uniref:hypothetical protein n=1 Tax=Actinospongicola halichondriae TaxID=3236844 RepID=UPI003D468773
MTAVLARAENHEGASASTGRFHAYAVRSRTGPHVTMQAGVIHANRFWTTTAADSLKARSVGAHGVATAVVPDGAGHRVVSGKTMVLRPFRPWDALDDVCAPVFAGTALARLSLAHLEQLVGYVEASGSIPSRWFPTRRVLLVTRIERSLVLRGDEVVDATGSWSGALESENLTVPTRSQSESGWLPYEQVAPSHRSVVRLGARVHLGVDSPTGPVSLPARWLGEDRFATSASALRAISAEVDGRMSAVFDQSARRRPDEKLGVLFRGSGRLLAVEGDQAVLGLSSERITTWDGFDADTVDVHR